MVSIRDGKVLRRKVARGQLVVELVDGGVVVRRRGCRRGGSAEVGITWTLVYQHALWIRGRAKRSAKKAARRGKV